MAYLQIDLGPTSWVIAVAVTVIVTLRVLDRRAESLAAARTRRAVQRALDGPTRE